METHGVLALLAELSLPAAAVVDDADVVSVVVSGATVLDAVVEVAVGHVAAAEIADALVAALVVVLAAAELADVLGDVLVVVELGAPSVLADVSAAGASAGNAVAAAFVCVAFVAAGTAFDVVA